MKIITMSLILINLITADLAASKISITVMELSVSEGLTQLEVKLLSDRLLNELVTIKYYDVIEKNKRDEILKEQGFQQSGACDQGKCLVEAGKLIGVEKIIGGTLGKIGLVYAIELRLIDIKTGKVEKAFSKTYSGDISVLLDGMKDAANYFSNTNILSSGQYVNLIKNDNNLIAQVDNKIITKSELQNYVKLYKKNNVDINEPDSIVQIFALEEMIATEILIKEAIKRGIDISNTEIDYRLEEIIASLRNRYKNDKEFFKQLKNEDLSLSDLKENYRGQVMKQLIVEKFINTEFTSKFDSISDAEAYNYYLKNKDLFKPVYDDEVKNGIKQNLFFEKYIDEFNKIMDELESRHYIIRKI